MSGPGGQTLLLFVVTQVLSKLLSPSVDLFTGMVVAGHPHVWIPAIEEGRRVWMNMNTLLVLRPWPSIHNNVIFVYVCVAFFSVNFLNPCDRLSLAWGALFLCDRWRSQVGCDLPKITKRISGGKTRIHLNSFSVIIKYLLNVLIIIYMSSYYQTKLSHSPKCGGRWQHVFSPEYVTIFPFQNIVLDHCWQHMRRYTRARSPLSS